jgi:transposase InsO family protein
MGAVGSGYDNSMIESFWGRMHTELLHRKAWRTRLELANAIFEYLEVFHNRRRRHSMLGMDGPVECETLNEGTSCHARNSKYPTPRNPGHATLS